MRRAGFYKGRMNTTSSCQISPSIQSGYRFDSDFDRTVGGRRTCTTSSRPADFNERDVTARDEALRSHLRFWGGRNKPDESPDCG